MWKHTGLIRVGSRLAYTRWWEHRTQFTSLEGGCLRPQNYRDLSNLHLGEIIHVQGYQIREFTAVCGWKQPNCPPIKDWLNKLRYYQLQMNIIQGLQGTQRLFVSWSRKSSKIPIFTGKKDRCKVYRCTCTGSCVCKMSLGAHTRNHPWWLPTGRGGQYRTRVGEKLLTVYPCMILGVWTTWTN